jgi:hypothetical protein
MGVVVKHVDGMPMDGLLRRTREGSFVVHLKTEVGRVRKNFTLAHELAHTFFYDCLMKHSPRFRGNNGADPEEEALCNLGASELLMPSQVFDRDLMKYRQDGIITALTLIKLANLYQVSLQAVTVKAVNSVPQLACALWSRSRSAINAQWVAPKTLSPLVLCQTGKSSVEMAFQRPGEVITSLDSFYCPRHGRRRIRRRTSSLRLRTGAVFSVLTAQLKQSKLSTTSNEQERLRSSPATFRLEQGELF